MSIVTIGIIVAVSVCCILMICYAVKVDMDEQRKEEEEEEEEEEPMVGILGPNYRPGDIFEYAALFLKQRQDEERRKVNLALKQRREASQLK
mmetsp:Transcript_5347/g.8999  ORF Transcript_5347/g.8999 Transcript_5347/m.8999 type:complete len:92 (+) Transcript_5347:406-681(+)